MSNRSVTYTLYLNSNVRQALQAHEQDALRLDKVMQGLQETMTSLGIGIGVHKAIQEAKEWIEEIAELEQGFIRIKNVSEDAAQGIKNQLFIREEVDKFKIGLEEAAHGYGEFLAMVKGAHMPSEQIRKLHDEILLIGKVQGLPDNQMNAAVRNLGKMLEVGGMDARHFFFFEQQLSGIGAYVAKEMGISLSQLAKLRHEGGLTGEDPKILLSAIQKMSEDMETRLPEALGSTRSELNDLNNTWLEFKESLIMDAKPAIVELLNDFKDFTEFLSEHQEQIYSLGGTIIKIAEYYALWRIGMLAANGLSSVMAVSMGLQEKQMLGSMRATNLETEAITRLAIALEELNAAQLAAAESSAILMEEQLLMGNISALTASQAQAAAFAASSRTTNSAVGSMMGGVNGAIQGALVSVILYDIMGAALEKLGVIGGKTTTGYDYGSRDVLFYPFKDYIASDRETVDQYFPNGFKSNTLDLLLKEITDAHNTGSGSVGLYFDKNGNPYRDRNEQTVKGSGFDDKETAERFYWAVQYFGDITKFQYDRSNNIDIPDAIEHAFDKASFKKGGYFDKHVFSDNEVVALQEFANASKEFASHLKTFQYGGGTFLDYITGKYSYIQEQSKGGKGSADEELKRKLKDLKDTNKIKGNSITNIHITIPEMNGIKTATFSVSGNMDINKVKEIVGVELTKAMTEVIADSQRVIEK